MRVAVLEDIHGNLPALEAVLDDVHGAGADRIVVGGDVFPGPMSHLALRLLLGCGLPVEFLFGNGEVALLDVIEGKPTKSLPEAYRERLRWEGAQLDESERRAIASWPMTLRHHVPPLGDVVFCHATPRNENEIFTQETAEDRLLPIFDSVNAALVVCGHTHMRFDRKVGRTRVVNPGSVGMPFGPPGADWLILGPEVELRHTDYDHAAAAERIRRSGYPAAEEYVTKYVLAHLDATDILKLYAQHELKG